MKRSFLDIIRGFVFRVFFGHHYDYQKILEKYGYALARPMTDIHRLSLMLPYILMKAMHLSVASIIVLDPKTGHYNIHAEDGPKYKLDNQTLNLDSPLVQELISSGKELFLAKTQNAAIVSEMEKLGAQLIIPAVSKSPKFPKPTLLFAIGLGKIR